MADARHITRRSALTSIAAIPACGLAGIVPAEATPVDPIIEAIANYEAGNEAYRRHPICDTVEWTDEEMEAVVEATYGPPLEALENWDQPVVTKEGAIAALQFLREESRNFYRPGCLVSMLTAALSYLEANT